LSPLSRRGAGGAGRGVGGEGRLALALFAVLLLLPAAGYARPGREVRKQQLEATAKLPEKYRQWLTEVAPILSEEERTIFLALTQDYQRDAFIESFWKGRDPYPRTTRNEFRERYIAKVAEAKQRFQGDLSDERARLFLLNGPPDEIVTSDCPLVLVPLEVWFYQKTDQVAEPLVLAFYRKWASTPFRLWHPQDGIEILIAGGPQVPGPVSAGAGGRERASGTGGGGSGGAASVGGLFDNCGADLDKSRKLAAAFAWIAAQGMHWDILQSRFDALPPEKAGEWVNTFKSYSTDIPADASPLSAKLEVEFPGRRRSRTVVQGVVTVTAAGAVESRLGEHRSYNFLLTGEVVRDGALFDNFRYKFDFPPGEGNFPLVFQRWLRPGEYTLIVKVEDVGSGRLFRAEQPLNVPEREREAPSPATVDPESAQLFAQAAEALGAENGEPAIQIVRPNGEMQTGMQRFDTLTTGGGLSGGIAGVTFTLDGKPVLTKRKPPFSVELDLGTVPRTRTLVATAFGPDGAELARDELTLNAAGHRFRLRLMEPQRGRRYTGSLLARAAVETPEGEALDHVDFFLNETRIATLFQPPWAQPVSLPRGSEVAYVRAVAYLTDGNSTEDLVFVNAPENLEEMNVDLVELYASVLDRDGHPVTGLTAQDFTVLEDGKKQDILRFDRVSDLPIHAVVALDVSASMEGSLDRAQQAALRFLQKTVRAKDRAAVIPFNDHPTLAVKFTHDLDALAGGLAGLKAERGTALYDTVVFSLYYFNGIKGQRALLLLSDGKDEGSRFTWEETLGFAKRAGVTIFAIGLGDQVEKKQMTRLAEETGGRAFFVNDATRLDEIYARIEDELRSQYLIAYQSTQSGVKGANTFRSVDLQVGKKGTEAKTIRGYYP
jgi:Ca-activated chloride channel family protein